MSTLTHLKHLEAAEARLNTKLGHMQDAIYALKLKLCTVQIGSIVVNTRTNVKHRIVEVDVSWDDWRTKPWLRGVPMRKDGTYGTAKRSLFDHWKPVK